MTFDPKQLERIKDAFAPLPGEDLLRPDCPSSELIWDAANGQLPSNHVRLLALHAARCSTCASTWRMANEARAVAGFAGVSTGGSPTRSYRVWGLAAAALFGLLAVGVFRVMHDSPPIVERTQTRASVESALGESARLLRSDFTLRWTDAGRGALYRIEVARQNLDAVFGAAGLPATQVTIPSDALAAVASGETLYWKVTAILPDGRVVEGITNTVTLQ